MTDRPGASREAVRFTAEETPPWLCRSCVRPWPAALPNPQVNLGLDLAGGSHLLLEAKADDVRAQRLDNMEESVRQLMRNASPRIRIGDVSTADGKLSFMLENAADIDRARGLIEPAMQGATTVREWELQVVDGQRIVKRVDRGVYLIAGQP